MRLAYPVEIREMTAEEDGGWLVTFPDWNGAVTDGGDRDEALTNAIDCLETMLDYCLRKGEDIPAPSPAKGRPLVVPDADLATKAALWRAFRNSGLSAGRFAAHLDMTAEQLGSRLFHPRARPRPATLTAAAAALGKRVVVELEDAA